MHSFAVTTEIANVCAMETTFVWESSFKSFGNVLEIQFQVKQTGVEDLESSY